MTVDIQSWSLHKHKFPTANTFGLVLIFKLATLHSLANHFGQQLSNNPNFLKQKGKWFLRPRLCGYMHVIHMQLWVYKKNFYTFHKIRPFVGVCFFTPLCCLTDLKVKLPQVFPVQLLGDNQHLSADWQRLKPQFTGAKRIRSACDVQNILLYTFYFCYI